jgi:hypothetical protein
MPGVGTAVPAEPMVAWCGLLSSDLWDKFWDPQQN